MSENDRMLYTLLTYLQYWAKHWVDASVGHKDVNTSLFPHRLQITSHLRLCGG